MGILSGKYTGKAHGSLWVVAILIPVALLAPVLFLNLEKEISPKVVVTESGIRVLDSIYGRSFLYPDLVMEQAAVMKLADAGKLVRTDGVYGLDYCAGWFRSETHQTVYLISANCRPEADVVRIPTKENGLLLLGAEDAGKLLGEIRGRTTQLSRSDTGR